MVVVSLVLMWYCVSMLCKFTAFLGTLHWRAGAEDMGHFEVSVLEVLILFEHWAGHWLLSENISISSVPVSQGIEIGQRCQCISSMVRALGKLSGGIWQVFTLSGWFSHFQGTNTVLTRSHLVNVSKRTVGSWVIQQVQVRSFWMER